MDISKLPIVRVWHGSPMNDGEYLGTAFQISPEYFITAKHVIEDIDEDKILLHVSVQLGPFSIRKVIKHSKLDVALLKLKDKIDSENIISLHFQEAQKIEIGNQLILAGYGTKDSALEIPNVKISSYDGEHDLFVIHTFIAKGMSGGPAFFDNHFVGIIRARHTDENKTYIIHLNSFQNFIEDYLQTPETTNEVKYYPKARKKVQRKYFLYLSFVKQNDTIKFVKRNFYGLLYDKICFELGEKEERVKIYPDLDSLDSVTPSCHDVILNSHFYIPLYSKAFFCYEEPFCEWKKYLQGITQGVEKKYCYPYMVPIIIQDLQDCQLSPVAAEIAKEDMVDIKDQYFYSAGFQDTDKYFNLEAKIKDLAKKIVSIYNADEFIANSIPEGLDVEKITKTTKSLKP